MCVSSFRSVQTHILLSLNSSVFPLFTQIAVTRVELHIRSVTPGGDPMKQEATCWSVSVWVTARESGHASLSVSQTANEELYLKVEDDRLLMYYTALSVLFS